MPSERFSRRAGDSRPGVGVGIDIGTSQIKIVVCSRMDSEVQVTHAWLLPVPSPEDERHATFREEACRWIQEAVRQVKQSGNASIAVALPTSQTALSMIPLSPVPAGHTEDSKLPDVGPYLPFPASEAIYDVQPLGHAAGRPREAFLAAARREIASDYAQELSALGVEANLLDVVALANANLIASVIPDGQVVAIVDIGAQTVDVVLLEGRRFRGAISFTGAGDDLTDAMTADFLGDARRAEAAKHERGLLDADLRPALRWWQDEFMHSVAEAIATCESQHGLKRLDRVVLFGGGAAVRGLRAALEEYLETPTAIGNPWHHLRIAPGVNIDPHPAFSVATGLAVRAMGEATFQINLKPRRRIMPSRARVRKPDGISFVIWGLVTVILLLVFGMVPLNIQRNYLDTLQVTLGTLQEQQKQVLQQRQQDQERRLARERLLLVERQKPRWSSLLGKLYASLPSGVSVKSLFWSKGEAIILKGEAASHGQVAAFIASLERTGQFGHTTLSKASKSATGIAFSLEIALRSGKGERP